MRLPPAARPVTPALTSPGGCDSIHPADSCIPEITPREPFACADSHGPLTRHSPACSRRCSRWSSPLRRSRSRRATSGWPPGPRPSSRVRCRARGAQVLEARRPAQRPRHLVLRGACGPAGRGSGRPRSRGTRRRARLRAARDGQQPDAAPGRAHQHRRQPRPRGAEQRVRHGADRDRRGQRRPARQGRLDRRGVVEAADVRRRADGVDPRGSDARERSGGSGAGAAVRPGDRPLHPGRSRREPVAGHDAQRRLADELRLRGRQPRRGATRSPPLCGPARGSSWRAWR